MALVELSMVCATPSGTDGAREPHNRVTTPPLARSGSDHFS
jgi:hypothetical protein